MISDDVIYMQLARKAVLSKISCFSSLDLDLDPVGKYVVIVNTSCAVCGLQVGQQP